MHLRVVEIAGGFYHSIVLLRERRSQLAINGAQGDIVNLKDFRAYHNQYNVKKYVAPAVDRKSRLDPFTKADISLATRKSPVKSFQQIEEMRALAGMEDRFLENQSTEQSDMLSQRNIKHFT